MKKMMISVTILCLFFAAAFLYANNAANWNKIKNLECKAFENELAKMASLNESIRTLGMCRIRCHNVFGNDSQGYSTPEKSACWDKCTSCY